MKSNQALSAERLAKFRQALSKGRRPILSEIQKLLKLKDDKALYSFMGRAEDAGLISIPKLGGRRSVSNYEVRATVYAQPPVTLRQTFTHDRVEPSAAEVTEAFNRADQTFDVVGVDTQLLIRVRGRLRQLVEEVDKDNPNDRELIMKFDDALLRHFTNE